MDDMFDEEPKIYVAMFTRQDLEWISRCIRGETLSKFQLDTLRHKLKAFSIYKAAIIVEDRSSDELD
jgi:hypothetical protein